MVTPDPQPQANAKPHPVDYVALGIAALAALAQLDDLLPAKYAGTLMVLLVGCRVYTKWLGSQQDKDALNEGEKIGAELKIDIAVAQAKPPVK